jgi:type IV pilus assembly protein PilV
VKIALIAFTRAFRAETPNRGFVRSNPKQQSGFSLIEVMVAALILSTAILGVAGLQMVGMKGTQQSYMKQQAMGVVHSMIERMRANHAGVVASAYLLDSEAFDCTTAVLPNCSTADCNPTQIALSDKINLVCGYKTTVGPRTGGIKVMSANDNVSLVKGTLNIACVDCAVGDVSITVGWDERAFDEEASTPNTITVNTRIGAP